MRGTRASSWAPTCRSRPRSSREQRLMPLMPVCHHQPDAPATAASLGLPPLLPPPSAAAAAAVTWATAAPRAAHTACMCRRWDGWARMMQPLLARAPLMATGGNHVRRSDAPRAAPAVPAVLPGLGCSCAEAPGSGPLAHHLPTRSPPISPAVSPAASRTPNPRFLLPTPACRRRSSSCCWTTTQPSPPSTRATRCPRTQTLRPS